MEGGFRAETLYHRDDAQPLVAEISCALIVNYRFSAECIVSLIYGLWCVVEAISIVQPLIIEGSFSKEPR